MDRHMLEDLWNADRGMWIDWWLHRLCIGSVWYTSMRLEDYLLPLPLPSPLGTSDGDDFQLLKTRARAGSVGRHTVCNSDRRKRLLAVLGDNICSSLPCG